MRRRGGTPAAPRRVRTLWSGAVAPGVFDYTAGPDREWDPLLLPYDILGSLGHVEGLRASGIVSDAQYRRLRAGLRAALRAAAQGRLAVTPADEDVHTAVERWLTGRLGRTGAMLHTGRSRNDQVACDLRLFLKDVVLDVHRLAADLTRALLALARRESSTLWPGYTHLRRAMPSSVGLWAAGYADGLLATLESVESVWAGLDRSPLGSAAGYGVPLPLRREAAARALGFAGLDHTVAAVQNGRGKVEAAALFWCVQLGHELGRLSGDVILLSAEEFGFLRLPPGTATGSSIMPHKRNPDVFELTRARAAAVEGDLAAVLAVRGKLTGGYHRDFQLLKEPLFRGLSRTAEALRFMAACVPGLAVDRERCRAAVRGDLLATDEVMRRVEQGVPFRVAYRDVAAALAGGEPLPVPSAREVRARRRSTGGVGNLGLPRLRARLAAMERWRRGRRRVYERALDRLAGRRRA